jgi:hypothetical protein
MQAHVLQFSSHAQPRAGHVGLHDARERLGVDVGELRGGSAGLPLGERRVVEGAVETAEMGRGVGHHGLDLGRTADVGAQGQCLAARLRDQ